MDTLSRIHWIVFQQIFYQLTINAVDTCYYRNSSNLVTITCPDDCCLGTPTSAETACCSRTSWSSFAVPVFVIGGICFLTICLIYLRPLLKACLCGCKCPCSHRFQVSSTSTSTAAATSADQIHVINNGDLPTYDASVKTQPVKDLTPPPYTFVTTHPNIFELEGRVTSATAPPQYTSRCNSAVTVRSFNSVDSSPS